jgi:hypothetical protein
MGIFFVVLLPVGLRETPYHTMWSGGIFYEVQWMQDEV